jgi:low molecular weight phosphotyrosine protein phosphatase
MVSEDKFRLLIADFELSRSPMAEAVLQDQVKQRASLKGKLLIEVDSAGTGAYHEGDQADDR